MIDLILILLARCSLEDLLMCTDSNGAKMHIPWGLRLQIAYEIAVGMDYIHSWKIIHRDLKSGNILINEHYHCYIIDFGISRSSRNHRMTLNLGTTSWMAPELFEGDGRYTPAVDVYSFGMLLWEIASRTRPHQNMVSTNIADCVIKGWRPDIPSNCPPSFAKLIHSAWAQNPQSRPTFAQIAATLKDCITKQTFSSLEKLMVPPVCPTIIHGEFQEILQNSYCARTDESKNLLGHQRNFSWNESDLKLSSEGDSGEDKDTQNLTSSDGETLLASSFASDWEMGVNRSVPKLVDDAASSSLPGVTRVKNYFRERKATNLRNSSRDQ
jgi:serine/threonine protein kinase